MPDLSHDDRLREAFETLLRDLAATWPARDIEYVREEVGYGEYGDALDNLIALGVSNGAGLGVEQAGQVEALAAAMGVEDSSFMARLRTTKQQAGVGSKPGNAAA